MINLNKKKVHRSNWDEAISIYKEKTHKACQYALQKIQNMPQKSPIDGVFNFPHTISDLEIVEEVCILGLPDFGKQWTIVHHDPDQAKKVKNLLWVLRSGIGVIGESYYKQILDLDHAKKQGGIRYLYTYA